MLGVFALAAAAAAKDYDPSAVVDHSPFTTLLAKYVVEDGVRYAAWQTDAADREALSAYVAALAAAKPSELTRYQRLAFWINAYNALTLDMLLEHYPVKSIRDIDSAWKRKVTTVEGRELSLDEIEHDIIRKEWKEPRVHFALNCAAASCPPLRPEAYDGPRLHEQLEEQTRAFLADAMENRGDEKGRLRLSRIFDWYREDFEQEKVSLFHWLRPYLAGLEGRDSADVRIHFEDYDWRLNESGAE
jgi:hypothetical protein